MVIFKRLDGNKVYLGMIAAGCIGIAVAQGWASWDSPTVQTITAAVTAWTGIAFRHAMKKGSGGSTGK